MTVILDMRSVSRTFGAGETAVVALRHADLEVRTGELVAIMGPSGSGKSTLLTIAGGLDSPSEGQVFVAGMELSELDPIGLARVRRQKVGYVFQELNLLSGLTAAENVSTPLELDGVRASMARTEALARLEEVGLSHKVDAFPEDLSGGERQRVAIARALTGDRHLVLADEPTGALDSATGEAILALLRRSCVGGAAVVVVTHDAAVAAAADRTLFMRDGRLDAEPLVPDRAAR